MDGCRRRGEGGLIKPDLCHRAFMAAGGNGWEEALCALSVRL